MKILISPYSQKLPVDKPNPKNYPYWEQVVKLIRQKSSDIEIIQVGVKEEKIIEGVSSVAHNFSQKELLELAKTCNAWLSVDNFFQHFCLRLNNLEEWTLQKIEASFKELADARSIKPGELQLPMRIMLVGGKFGPAVFEIAGLIGKEETVRRIENVLSLL